MTESEVCMFMCIFYVYMYIYNIDRTLRAL